MAKPRTPKKEILTLKVSLDESKPEIWRRFKISENMTLAGLHDVIQRVMGWQDYHLHEFEIEGKKYGPMHSDPPEDMIDEESVRVSETIKRIGTEFKYIYDFGDDWVHTVIVENVRVPGKHEMVPYCIDGAMACPPEDSGGIHGYYEKLDILQDPKHEEFKETRQWMGKDFDKNKFDFDEVTTAVVLYKYKKKAPPN